jgi:hypothetical protein
MVHVFTIWHDIKYHMSQYKGKWTNSMQLSLSVHAISRPASQENSRPLKYVNVNYSVHKNPAIRLYSVPD